MQTQNKSQIQQEENIPIKNSEYQQVNQQNHQIQLNQQDRIQQSSIPVSEKTKLPVESNINLNQNNFPGFQEIPNNWIKQVPYQQSSIVAQQIQSEVNQVQQSSNQQIDNQQFMIPQSMSYQPGSGIPTHHNLTQIPKLRLSQCLQCKWCNQEVFSQIEHKIGLTQVLLCLFFLPAFGIGLIFIFCDTFKDCQHFCTNCSCELGEVKLIDFQC
ncbi:unnamed protein product [Paramecium pentaurelia]|uniref:LITAF domain-containing protein n=1 Tax=Paramecium pentaurelia TaxID=43138 RepID=A0A8S1V025_9CILI|nr:unnamed protein product [Paramecium pentaurelia]